MQWVIAFLAGFLSTTLFHQGMVIIFAALGADVQPFRTEPVAPFGVPAIVSLAFWGGVWGIPVWWLIRRLNGAAYWAVSTLAGAVGPTTVAMLVVFPLKGLAVTAQVVGGGLIANGAWGFGVGLVMYPVLFKLTPAERGLTGPDSNREEKR